jgi:hypothetical protein
MQDDPIFEVCLISELLRPEINQKATILGFFGRSPHVTIKVHDPQQPLADLAFLFLSRPMPKRVYRVGLSVKDPNGVLLFPMSEQTAEQSQDGDTISLGYSFRPFKLTGAGSYDVNLLVDDKLDLQSRFTIIAAQPNEIL